MKPIKTKIKLQISGGNATPAPPIGPALGQHGLSIQDFCNQFNERTKEKRGEIVPVEITVYEDRSFDFITKTSPAAELIKKAINVQKGSPEAHKKKIGTLSREQLTQIAETKMGDLNTDDSEAAKKIIAGTARSMGVKIEE